MRQTALAVAYHQAQQKARYQIRRRSDGRVNVWHKSADDADWCIAYVTDRVCEAKDFIKDQLQ